MKAKKASKVRPALHTSGFWSLHAAKTINSYLILGVSTGAHVGVVHVDSVGRPNLWLTMPTDVDLVEDLVAFVGGYFDDTPAAYYCDNPTESYQKPKLDWPPVV